MAGGAGVTDKERRKMAFYITKARFWMRQRDVSAGRMRAMLGAIARADGAVIAKEEIIRAFLEDDDAESRRR
jgi:hypothetical protein